MRGEADAWDEKLIVRGRVNGTEAEVEMFLDRAEIARRCEGDALTTVNKLQKARGIDALLDNGAQIHLDGGEEVQPAAYPVHVRVTDDSWDRGFARVSKFAGYAARTLTLTEPPTDIAVAELEARYYGFGLEIIDHLGETRTVVPAAPFTRERVTAAWWVFTERVAQMWADQSSSSFAQNLRSAG
jgi:hypothetical protein